MKKLITILTILTIMIVLVGAVFAADPAPADAEGTATIDIKASIGPQYPTFQLKVTESTSVTINTATSDLCFQMQAGIFFRSPDNFIYAT